MEWVELFIESSLEFTELFLFVPENLQIKITANQERQVEVRK